MSKSNKNMHSAKRAKNDEFYTQLTDIENELRYYKEHFKGKIVLCNCNDAIHGNFKKYFITHFNEFGLKQLVTIAYEEGYAEYYDGKNITISHFNGKGDFRSEECIELLKKCDIVCTNPPFSLFREYVAQLVQYDKKFLIIGNMNAITYKEVFPLIRDNKLWYGPSISSGDREFMVPESYPIEAAGWRIDENGKKYIRIKGVRWFTNLGHKKRHEVLDLYKHYTEEEYPKYDNYNAINVNKTCDIPLDYDGVMGVPITFLDKYCPTQFEIVGFWNAGIAGENVGASYCEAISKGNTIIWNGPTVKKQTKYFRILIKRIS